MVIEPGTTACGTSQSLTCGRQWPLAVPERTLASRRRVRLSVAPAGTSYEGEDDDDPVEPVKEELSDLEIARRLAFLLAQGNPALECSQEALLSSSPPVTGSHEGS